MASWNRHAHECPTCGALWKCKMDCTITTRTTKPLDPGKPVGPIVHGGSGAMYLGAPKECFKCREKDDGKL